MYKSGVFCPTFDQANKQNFIKKIIDNEFFGGSDATNVSYDMNSCERIYNMSFS